jgi:ketosteroid isomerase-like protein
VYRGVDAVLEYLASIGDAVERFDSSLEDVLVGEGTAAVLFRVVGERRGRRLDTRFILLFRVEEGRIAEVWAVPRDQHAVDEFWA